MSDLRTFLLARIADDEERSQFVAQQIEGSPWASFEQWSLSWHDEYDLLCIEPSRGIAECEAKRSIVERHRQYAHSGFCECCFDDYPCADLRTLGAIYDQHPDYREEWRP